MKHFIKRFLGFSMLIVATITAVNAGAQTATTMRAVDADKGPFLFPRTDLLDAAPRAVFVAFMGNYHSAPISGSWTSWDYHHHDPGKLDAHGHRDIASCFYPVIGPYDQTDPDLVEYHCQLLKLTGIDGISFNLSFFASDPWRQKSMKLYVDAMRRYGLSGFVRFENKFYANIYPDPKQALAAAYADMDSWLALMDPVQFQIAGRPVFSFFTFRFTPEELRAWKEKFPEERRPILLTEGADPKYRGIVEGRFGWTGDQPKHATDHAPYISYVDAATARLNEQYTRQRAFELLDRGQISLYMAGVSPGFDDIGCWGWEKGPRKVERDDGRTYQFRWEQQLKTNLPLVLIPTFNDWAEGTTIEPSVEYETKYLEMTRDYAAKFKARRPSNTTLMLPVWIYQIRKATTDAAALRDMTTASAAIAAGKDSEAQAIVETWAKKLAIGRR